MKFRPTVIGDDIRVQQPNQPSLELLSLFYHKRMQRRDTINCVCCLFKVTWPGDLRGVQQSCG